MADITTLLITNGPQIIGAIVGGAVAAVGAVAGFFKTLAFVRSVKANATKIAEVEKRLVVLESARRHDQIRASERKRVQTEQAPSSRISVEDALTARSLDELCAAVEKLEGEQAVLGKTLSSIETLTRLLLDGKIRTP